MKELSSDLLFYTDRCLCTVALARWLSHGRNKKARRTRGMLLNTFEYNFARCINTSSHAGIFRKVQLSK